MGEGRSCHLKGDTHNACLSSVFLCICSRKKPHTFSASLQSTFIFYHGGLPVPTDPLGPLTAEQMPPPGFWRAKYLPLGTGPSMFLIVGCVLLVGKSQECWIYLCSHLIPSRSQYIG